MRKILLSAFLFFSVTALADVTMPHIFSDNMVLQRDKPLRIWGWADKGEKITVSVNGQTQKTKAAKDGSWSVMLKAMPTGGPYDLSISGKNNIVYKNVLLGDVYVCSGQSNMEWMLQNTNNAKEEIANASHPQLRLFTVKKETSFRPLKDVEGKWDVCTPETVPDFSAVAYFFGRKLNADIGVPIGLIHTSWGGTNIQTWISWDEMSQYPEYKNVDVGAKQKQSEEAKKNQAAFVQSLANDKGDMEKWYASPATADWKEMKLPQLWENTPVGNADGNIWFKKSFTLPAEQAGKAAYLHLGPIDDNDVTYVNGVQVGATNSYSTDRVYDIPAGTLRDGTNEVTVKVIDTGGGGGIYGEEKQMSVEAGGKSFPLAGIWQYRPSVLNTNFGLQNSGPNSFPSQLYNAMIAPIINYAIKGAIWYQGESNAGESFKYRTLFPQMINDWRKKWGYDFPFFWAQLANFMPQDSIPQESGWAELREAQSMTLSLPATGQAVIIDIGERNDIHPRNKQDVGYRLALAAEKVVYDKDIVYSGPVYTSMQKEGNKIVLKFTNTGSGLDVHNKYGYLQGFTIAGADKKFHYAQAKVTGDGEVTVSSDKVSDPVAVRYAWANNPDDANLYNKEGLPASPFRTDTWKGITEK